MDRHPGCAGCSVDERIEQRPIGNGVAAVEHAFGFAIGRCDRTGIEMITADHDRRFDFTPFHEFAYGNAKLSALAVTEPANPRRQPLILNSLLSELHPARQRLVFWK